MECYAWINFTWVIGTHYVIIAPGQIRLLKRLNRNEQRNVYENKIIPPLRATVYNYTL